MFKNLRNTNNKTLNHSGKSLVGETLQIEGDIRSSGSVDISGLVNGNVFVSNLIINEVGSVRGSIEATTIEINGHVEGKVLADSIIIGNKAIVKGDLVFRNTLKTEEGADIDGYIKRVNNGKLKNSEEDIAIEEIVDRQERKPIAAVVQQKEAV
jgi:cytoskeletal protein CcmA (bactofilin family)